MIKGRCALVTGSVGGIGLATVRALAAEGCNVVMNGFGDADEIEALRGRIAAETGVKVVYHGADLSSREQIEGMIADVEREIGPVDILVNNAITRHYAPIEEFPTDRWEYALAVNLSAPFHTIRLTMPHMKRQRWGRIINIASNLGLTAVPNRVDYITTKHGIIGLTRAVALEGLEAGVTCNAICPGSTLTPHAKRQLEARASAAGVSEDEVVQSFLAERQPSRRFVLPEDVAALIVFLCGDAAREMTGTPVSIDGGWLAAAS